MQALAEGLAHGVLDGLEEGVRHGAELHLQPEADAGAGRCGVDAQADRREERVGVLLVELHGLPRADEPFDAQGRGLAEGDAEAVLLGEGGLDDLLLYLAVQGHGSLLPPFVVAQADQRVLFGQLGEREVQCATVHVRTRDDDGLQGGRGEEVLVRLAGFADRVADPDVAESPEPGDLSGDDGVAPGVRPLSEDADRGDPPFGAVRSERDPVAGAQRAGEQPGIGGLLPRRAPLDLEHGPGERPVRVPVGRGQQVLDARQERVHTGARGGGAEEDGVDQGLPGLSDEGGVQKGVRDGVLDVRGQQRVVVAGEDVERGRAETGREASPARAEAGGGSHRHDRGCQPGRDRPQHLLVPRPAPVDLVDEEQGRDAQPLERPHQHPRLCLHPFDGGDDEHDAVQHAEHTLHLGNEVRVTGSVDQVDRHTVEGERDDGGLDGDATLPLQRECVGTGVPVVDAADPVDHPGRMEQPLGQAGLTGVDMGEDSKVEHVHEASCPSERGPFLAGGT